MTAQHSDTVDSISLRKPDDWHVHLRDGDILETVVPYTTARFARAVIMPNLVPPVTTVDAAIAYRDRIMAAVPQGCDFTPLMACYLTSTLDPAALMQGHADGVFFAAKLYPAGATTNSQFGVAAIDDLFPVLEAMEKGGMPLLVHGEAIDPAVDIFDRERVFIEQTLIPLRKRFPGLKIVMEHITTAEAVDYIIAENNPRLGATITPHHLMISRNALFAGGIRPHLYCLPIVKREKHRLALRRAALSGLPFFFAGTDTAPHTVAAKECACGCAGIFNAPIALECYAQVFAEENALDRFEAFMSLNGPRFHGMVANEERITLRRRAFSVAESVPLRIGSLRPFLAGEQCAWSLEE